MNMKEDPRLGLGGVSPISVSRRSRILKKEREY